MGPFPRQKISLKVKKQSKIKTVLNNIVWVAQEAGENECCFFTGQHIISKPLQWQAVPSSEGIYQQQRGYLEDAEQ